jgi:signal transduction histidine kinase
MIIASRNRARLQAEAATIEPATFGDRRTAPESAAAMRIHEGSPPAPLRRLRAAVSHIPRRAAAPRGSFRAALTPGLAAAAPAIALAVLAGALGPWARLEPHAAGGQLAVEAAVRLLCALAAVLCLHRFWRGRRLGELLVVYATAALAASYLAAGALLVCACVEWSLEERRAAALALARERRRIAADVHDLIMQDLSFALANARTLVDDPARASQASTIVSAGERALAGARSMVSGLTEHDTRPIALAVEASVRAAARRTPLAFHAAQVPSSAPLDEPTRDALVHIAREAVTNAVKHARAGAVEVVLEHAGQWRLTVRDDGRGFDEAPGSEGFGLASMRHSAHALGGAVHVGRASGGGTTVEAVLP